MLYDPIYMTVSKGQSSTAFLKNKKSSTYGRFIYINYSLNKYYYLSMYHLLVTMPGTGDEKCSWRLSSCMQRVYSLGVERRKGGRNTNM